MLACSSGSSRACQQAQCTAAISVDFYMQSVHGWTATNQKAIGGGRGGGRGALPPNNFIGGPAPQ